MHLDFTLSLPQPIQQVYAALVDFTRVKDWQPNVQSVDVDPAGEVKLGSRVKVVRTFRGKSVESLGEITELTPPRAIRIESPVEAPDPAFVSEYRLFKEGTGTLMNFSITYTFKGFDRLMAPFIEKAARAELEEHFVLFRKLMETKSAEVQ